MSSEVEIREQIALLKTKIETETDLLETKKMFAELVMLHKNLRDMGCENVVEGSSDRPFAEVMEEQNQKN